ncbi:MAG: response regulator [Halobacteria archaeon]|nr:response regulator [Halobacteria archaeon]
MRVLLVDDEKEFVSTLAERLLLRGIEADWVASAEEALEKIKEAQYDLAVLDVKMPHISGIELKRILHEHRPDMQFIFMTGHGSEQDFHAGSSEAGAAYYLVKPVHIEDLMRKMNEVLGREQ